MARKLLRLGVLFSQNKRKAFFPIRFSSILKKYIPCKYHVYYQDPKLIRRESTANNIINPRFVVVIFFFVWRELSK